MKRVWGNVLSAASLLAGAAVVFSACVHDDSTLFVREVMAPPSSGSTGGALCTYTPDPTLPYLSSGLLDIAVRQQYDAVLLVGNQMVPEVNQSQLQTETSTITLQGAVVRITDFMGNPLTSYTRLATASLPPASGSTPGYATIALTILDSVTTSGPETAVIRGQALGFSGVDRFISYVKVFGVTLGGKSIESNELEFPIDVCYGCLVQFTNVTVGTPPPATPNCRADSSATTTITTAAPCILGEDQTVDCTLVCDAIPTCAQNTN